MDINEILQLDFEKALGQLCKDPRELDKNITENRDAYNGKHTILDDPERKPKKVNRLIVGDMVIEGNTIRNKDSRIGISFDTDGQRFVNNNGEM